MAALAITVSEAGFNRLLKFKVNFDKWSLIRINFTQVCSSCTETYIVANILGFIKACMKIYSEILLFRCCLALDFCVK